MSTNAVRCAGSGMGYYDGRGIFIGGAKPCPGCEDCRPTLGHDPLNYEAAPLGRPIPPGDPEPDLDTEQPVPITHGNIAPYKPVEAMARRLEALGAELTRDIAGMPRDAAAMLRALDRECDRLRAALTEVRTASAPGNLRANYEADSVLAATAAGYLGHTHGFVVATLATDAREVDRG